MKKKKWGRIINIASAHALVASPFKSAYVAAKHGMLGLTKKVHPSIKKKAINIAAIENGLEDEKLFDGYQEVFNMEDDNGVFRKELIRILENE